MTELSIFLFGSVRVLQSEHELTMRPVTRMLLLYLLLHREKHHRREELASIFWGDVDDTKARHSLNTALWKLRQEIMTGDLINGTVQGDLTVNLHHNDYLDVAAFEHSALAGLKKSPESLKSAEIKQLEQAANLYQGDLAENCYYDWILPERERLRALYLDTLTLIMQAYSHQRAYPQAVAVGRQILQSDPLREDVHRHMMRLYIAMDQRSSALQQYMSCWQVLQDELHLTPMPETTALYEHLMGPEPFTVISIIPTASTVAPQAALPNLDRLIDVLNVLQKEVQRTLQELRNLKR